MIMLLEETESPTSRIRSGRGSYLGREARIATRGRQTNLSLVCSMHSIFAKKHKVELTVTLCISNVDRGQRFGWANRCVPRRSHFLLDVDGETDTRRLSEDVNETLDHLFVLQEELYEAGARNFLFMNVPPLPGLPKSIFKGEMKVNSHQIYQSLIKSNSLVQPEMLKRADERRLLWNTLLSQKAAAFAESHVACSAFVFDAHSLFTRILTDPPSFGFPSGGRVGMARDGEVWCDHIHPTTTTHDIVARELAKFLAGRDVEERQPRLATTHREDEEVVFEEPSVLVCARVFETRSIAI